MSEPEIVTIEPGEVLAENLEEELVFTTASEQTCTLWHYTNAAGLQGILNERTIRATHVAYMNDRAELTIGEDLIVEVAKALAEGPAGVATHLFKELERNYPALCLSSIGNIFVASFCNDGGNRLSQWRGYGGGCGGYSIGFRELPTPAKTATPADLGVGLVEVIYGRDAFLGLATLELQKIAHTVERHCIEEPEHQDAFFRKGWELMLRRAGSLAIRAKHDGFREEFEWRLVASPHRERKDDGTPVVQHRATPRGLVPYVEIPLTHEPKLPLEAITIGPTQDPEYAAYSAPLEH